MPATKSVDYALNSDYATFSGMPDVQIQQRTDVVYPEVFLYIEGVQIPFEYISVSNSYGGTPEAQISVPYFSGLQEICRGYFPKVSIFFRDNTYERFLQTKGVSYDDKEVRRLLFSGVIIGTDYSKKRSTESDSVSISFRCIHKYYAVKEVLVKMIGGGVEQLQDTAMDAAAVARSNYFNTDAMILDAMRGIKIKIENTDKPVVRPKDLKTPDTDMIPNHLQGDLSEYRTRFAGIPGTVLALWNIIKRDSYNQANYSQMMTELYIPLVDGGDTTKGERGGLNFFKRMHGHGVLEGIIEDGRLSKNLSEYAKKVEEGKITTADPSLDLIVPPAFRNMVQDATAIDIGTAVMKTALQNQGEMMDFISLCAKMLKAMRYDFEVLAAPIQKPGSAHSVDVLVKPLMPFYYSPICNVLLPYMYSSVSVQDFTYSVPTRCMAKSSVFVRSENGNSPIELAYRSPNDVRIATAVNNPQGKTDLASTTVKIGEYPTPEEYGRGVKYKPLNLDPWVNYLVSAMMAEGANGTMPNDGSFYDKNLTNPNHTAYKENRRLINPATSEFEDPADTTRVWKYWDPEKKIPKYIASINTPGLDMKWGEEGKATSTVVNNKIGPFRKATNVPKFWNVIYFESGNQFLVFPPHYDYVGDIFFRTDAIQKVLESGKEKDPYNVDPAAAKPTAEEEIAEQVAAAEVVETTSNLKDYWDKKNPGFPSMNPYADKSVNGIEPYQASIFAVVDYDYSLSLVESRVGNVEGPFNPYIIAGYPMDIIDPSPERPSIHGFCTSVNHAISASSISTTVGFVSALTYDELRSYELPAIMPWFQHNLGMTDKLSLMDQGEEALEKANQFYLGLLGCGFADPTILEDVTTGGGVSLFLDRTGRFIVDPSNVYMTSNDSTFGQSYRDAANPNLTYEGNLAMVRREIETMTDVEFLQGVKFIDIQSRSSLASIEDVKVNPLYREIPQRPGRSIFLNYSAEEEAQSKKYREAGGSSGNATNGVST